MEKVTYKETLKMTQGTNAQNSNVLIKILQLNSTGYSQYRIEVIILFKQKQINTKHVIL